MKNLTSLFTLSLVAASAFANSQEYLRYELSNVQITSFNAMANPPLLTVTKGNNSYTIIVGPRVNFTRTENGITRRVSYETGIRSLQPGRRIDVVARRSPQGIIAVLIAL